MKTLYLDCSMGAAGDMLLASLLEHIAAPDSFITRLNYLGIPGVRVVRESIVRGGITGTHVVVTVHGVEEDEHSHSHGGHTHSHTHGDTPHEHGSMTAITELLDSLEVTDWVRDNAKAVYNLIADAESKAHGVPVSQVHFHEVGAMDAVADIVGVCMLLEELAPDRIVASHIHVGCGQVKCAHGILPVPAPATAHILRGVPIYGGEVSGELCTPTGAAILRHFVGSYGNMPTMSVTSIGYGMGSRDFGASVNCLRTMIGEPATPFAPNDRIVELSCNIDDMTGEAMGYATCKLLELGALDVFTLPIMMKKCRPAQMLVCLVTPDRADNMAAEMLRYTTTFGVRRCEYSRYALDRTVTTIPTKYGDVRVKSGQGYGVEKMKPEYDDIAAIANEHGMSISEVLQALEL